MPKYDKNVRLIKPVLEGDKLHYQTDPYLWRGKVVVKRLATVPVRVIPVVKEKKR